jgi:hypothetical protein
VLTRHERSKMWVLRMLVKNGLLKREESAQSHAIFSPVKACWSYPLRRQPASARARPAAGARGGRGGGAGEGRSRAGRAAGGAAPAGGGVRRGDRAGRAAQGGEARGRGGGRRVSQVRRTSTLHLLAFFFDPSRSLSPSASSVS